MVLDKADRVKAAFKLLLKVSLIYSTLLWACVMLFPGGFAAMFTNVPAAAWITRRRRCVFIWPAMLLFGIQMACQMTFTSLGKAKASILVAVMRKFILLIPLIYLLPAILPIDQTLAVYMAEPVADFIAVTFTAIFFTFQFKKVLKEMA